MIFADKQIIARAHAQGVRVIGATLTPFQGAGTYTPAKEAIREAVNQWIRTTDQFDGTVDFEAAVRDAANPEAFREGFTGFDHLHPTDTGYAAMAASVNLDLAYPALTPGPANRRGCDHCAAATCRSASQPWRSVSARSLIKRFLARPRSFQRQFGAIGRASGRFHGREQA